MNLKSELEIELERKKNHFGIRGFIDADDNIYPIGSDTKVLSTAFELLIKPQIYAIAARHNMKVAEAPQTIYPDFTLLRSQDDKKKIAIDIKTTYRKPQILFTLGSYSSFFRDGKKNILFPYNEYDEHWVVGFVYNRLDNVNCAPLYSFEKRFDALCPIDTVEWFVQEKYKIAGESPGSGNTTNIGSIRTRDINDFRQGKGPFAELGRDVFHHYWANFQKEKSDRLYTNLSEYFTWRGVTS